MTLLYPLSRELWHCQRLQLSPNTICHILRRNGLIRPRKRRQVCYSAHWAWETKRPFALAQGDVKDIRDEATLGPRLVHRLTQAKLPRYQWTFLEGSEWGGESLQQIERLNRRFFQPLGARLVRFPLGRKGYNGRVERSHRTDDEEFSLPLLMGIKDEGELVQRAAQWLYYYNVERGHTGVGMEGLSPWQKLRGLGVKVPKEFAVLPPMVLDRISTDWVLDLGNDLLTHYKTGTRRGPVSTLMGSWGKDQKNNATV